MISVRLLKIFILVSMLIPPKVIIAAEGAYKLPPSYDWSFAGPLGTFDPVALQRGYQVYREVCASCHALEYLHYRDLAGIGYSPEEIKAIAAQDSVSDGPNDEGDMFTRPATPTDRMARPFPNAQMARAANNGALPPDLSLITKARVQGVDYLHALLQGYEEDPPEGVTVMEGMYYNSYFPAGQIAMAPPLMDGLVDYADGTQASLSQMAEDVTTFLAWAADPKMEERKRMGVKVMAFLIVFTFVMFWAKKRIWARIH